MVSVIPMDETALTVYHVRLRIFTNLQVVFNWFFGLQPLQTLLSHFFNALNF